MPFDFLDDVLLLHLALKPAQSIFEAFTFLDPDFGQPIHPQTRPTGPGIVMARFAF
jgi:hypothetical protein